MFSRPATRFFVRLQSDALTEKKKEMTPQKHLFICMFCLLLLVWQDAGLQRQLRLRHLLHLVHPHQHLHLHVRLLGRRLQQLQEIPEGTTDRVFLHSLKLKRFELKCCVGEYSALIGCFPAGEGNTKRRRRNLILFTDYPSHLILSGYSKKTPKNHYFYKLYQLQL